MSASRAVPRVCLSWRRSRVTWCSIWRYSGCLRALEPRLDGVAFACRSGLRYASS